LLSALAHDIIGSSRGQQALEEESGMDWMEMLVRELIEVNKDQEEGEPKKLTDGQIKSLSKRLLASDSTHDFYNEIYQDVYNAVYPEEGM
jgi:hypothetical protein